MMILIKNMNNINKNVKNFYKLSKIKIKKYNKLMKNQL